MNHGHQMLSFTENLLFHILYVECVEENRNFSFRDFRFLDTPDLDDVTVPLLAIRRLGDDQITWSKYNFKSFILQDEYKLSDQLLNVITVNVISC